MKKLRTAAVFCGFFALGMAFFSLTANAYIDPSAMTYIVQLVVGIVIACGGAFAFYFRKLKRKLSKKDAAPANMEVAIPDDDDFDDSEFDESSEM